MSSPVSRGFPFSIVGLVDEPVRWTWDELVRCPTCDDLALRLARQGDRVVFELFGTWTLREPGPPDTRGPV